MPAYYRERREWLELQWHYDPKRGEYWGKELKELERAEDAWYALYRAQDYRGCSTPDAMDKLLRNLNELRILIGDEAYAAGQMPFPCLAGGGE